jgi:predicted nucleotide-binding protein
MKKSKDFIRTRFSAETIQRAFEMFSEITSTPQSTARFATLSIETERELWDFDNVDEWLVEYTQDHVWFRMYLFNHECDAHLCIEKSQVSSTHVSVAFRDRENIQKVFRIFEDAYPISQIVDDEDDTSAVQIETSIFIGHGGNQQWRELKEHLQDKHKLNVIAYETGARSGHAIRDILDDLVREATFAILVMTAEDEQADGSFRARQNVVHEAGLFQGALGFSRAIILLEEGVETFSNVDGIQYIPFKNGHIAETYGDILATLKREFGRN